MSVFVSVVDAVDVLDKWDSALSVSFGPAGSGTLVHLAGDRMTITTKGLRIVQALEGGQQQRGGMAKLLLKTLESADTRVGDGTKFIVHIMLQFCRKFTGPRRQRDHFIICSAFHFIETVLLPRISDAAESHSIAISSSDERQVLSHLVQSFMKSRFPHSVAVVLSQVFINFASRGGGGGDELVGFIKSASELFQELWLEVPGCSVSDSKIVPGVVITRQVDVLPPASRVSFAIWWRPDDPSSDAQCELTRDNMSSVLSWEGLKLRRKITAAKERGVNFLIAVCGWPGYLITLCRAEKVGLINNVAEEEAVRLAVVANLVQYDDEGVGSGSWEEGIGVGDRCYTVLRPDDGAVAISLVLCAPSAELCREYGQAFLDCLRMLRVWATGSRRVLHSNGRFELVVGDFLRRSALTSDVPVQYRQIVSWLGDSLLSIPSRLNPAGSRGVFQDMLKLHQGALNSSSDEGFEAVSVKCELLTVVLRTLCQVIKIDGIVQVRGKISDRINAKLK